MTHNPNNTRTEKLLNVPQKLDENISQVNKGSLVTWSVGVYSERMSRGSPWWCCCLLLSQLFSASKGFFFGIRVVSVLSLDQTQWSELTLGKDKAAGLMDGLTHCSVIGTVSVSCCSPPPLTYICMFPHVQDSCCQSTKGTAAAQGYSL